MKPIFLFFILFLSSLLCKNHAQSEYTALVLEAGPTINSTNLNWSIAGNLQGDSPNVLSELKFKRITSLGYYLNASYTPVKYLTFSTYFQNNEVNRGHGSDIDYKDDNRTNPTFEKSFISNKGNFKNLKTGIGFPIYLNNKFEIIPSLNYFLMMQQYFLLSNETQNLNSTYEVNMQGVEIALEGQLRFNKILFSSLLLNYHFANYEAEADWNLIDIFQHPLSFSQASKGSGLGLIMEVGATINQIVSVILSGSLNNTYIKKGLDTSYLANGNEIVTQFNGGSINMYGIRIGLRISI